jgi:hypothetical protein
MGMIVTSSGSHSTMGSRKYGLGSFSEWRGEHSVEFNRGFTRESSSESFYNYKGYFNVSENWGTHVQWRSGFDPAWEGAGFGREWGIG